MRGRTLDNAFVILDEGQNTTHNQMKMFLTRMGNNAKFMINGDPGQIDLPRRVISGLKEANLILKNVDGIKMIYLDDSDVIRHQVVKRIIEAYKFRTYKLKIMNTLTKTNYNFDNQKSKYSGKVREVYNIDDKILIMIATDRLSAFDVVLPRGIPYKGQILNQIACKMLNATSHIVPNWLISTPDPNVSIGDSCTPFKVEMVIRGYLSGHAARLYKSGKRSICGVKMPDGMNENDKFPNPIITPTTKAENGSHDEDISRNEIVSQKIVSESEYLILEDYTRKLFKEGGRIAESQGLILVDTKYEFGKNLRRNCCN